MARQSCHLWSDQLERLQGGKRGRVNFKSYSSARLRWQSRRSRLRVGVQRPGSPLGSWARVLSEIFCTCFADWPMVQTQSTWASVLWHHQGTRGSEQCGSCCCAPLSWSSLPCCHSYPQNLHCTQPPSELLKMLS